MSEYFCLSVHLFQLAPILCVCSFDVIVGAPPPIIMQLASTITAWYRFAVIFGFLWTVALKYCNVEINFLIIKLYTWHSPVVLGQKSDQNKKSDFCPPTQETKNELPELAQETKKVLAEPTQETKIALPELAQETK